MRLEEVVDVYGWEDYYDMASGAIYKLSEAVKVDDNLSKVFVEQDGKIIGFTTVDRIKE